MAHTDLGPWPTPSQALGWELTGLSPALDA